MANVQLLDLGPVIKAAYEDELNTNAFTDADHTKLDGIESAATADQTGSEIEGLLDTELANTDWKKAVGTGAGDVAAGNHAHTGVYEPVDATIIREADVDDTPVNGVTTAPVSSNWAYDHANGADPHPAYELEANVAEDARDAVGTALTNSSTVTWTVNDPTDTISAAVTEGGIDALNLANAPAEANADVTDATNVAAAGALMTDGSQEMTGDIVFAEAADHSSTPVAGKGYLWTKNTVPSTLIFTDDAGTDTELGSTGTTEVSDDLTPELGGDLVVAGHKITSTGNNNVNIEPSGTGNVLLGNLTFDADQAVGIGQDNYVLTYDDASGTIGLESAAAGGGGDLLAANNLSDVDNAATSFGNIKQAATDSSSGVVELATTAETTTGTDTGRAVTPDGLKDGYQGSVNVTTLGVIGAGTWQGDVVDHERGGLEVNVSAYNGLIKISGGTTSQAIADTDYQSVLAEGAFADGAKTKLDNIEPLADVTDETNVKAALDGATVTNAVITATDKVLFQDATDSDNLKQDDAQTLANLAQPEGTAIKSTGESGGAKFLREDGDGTCSWQTPAGSGDVSKVGTPVADQIGVWTGDGTLEGDSALTFNATGDVLSIAASGGLAFGAVTILDDTAGSMALQNIDSIDATTEATIEAAIDCPTSADVTVIDVISQTAYDALSPPDANTLYFING